MSLHAFKFYINLFGCQKTYFSPVLNPLDYKFFRDRGTFSNARGNLTRSIHKEFHRCALVGLAKAIPVERLVFVTEYGKLL